MSHLPLGFSEINKKERKEINKKICERNKTYKNQKKVSDVLEAMEDKKEMENFEAAKLSNPPALSSPIQTGNVDAATYYKQYVPYYTNTNANNEQSVSGNSGILLEKLNYMIHMLEEQQEGKTETVTEELILYLFLGVFVIFTVDSFARAGKYTR